MKRRQIKVDPTIVLTRPAPQAKAFADALISVHGGSLPILIAPLMDIVPVTPDTGIGTPEHVIFTSKNAVAQAARLGVPKTATAWCVGASTAKAAAALGLQTQTAEGDSKALVSLMKDMRPTGEILHLRGAHVTGQVVMALQDAGLKCSGCIVYDQVSRPPSERLKAALVATHPLIVPLFSPRSARLFAQTAPHTAPISIIAMSPAVASDVESLATRDVFTANFPDKNHMITAILHAFAAISGSKMP